VQLKNLPGMNNTYVVIMAGGIGSRFWPMSIASFPKQFHDVLGTGRTLIQQTAERFLPICPYENMFVVTNASYKQLVRDQLPGIPEENILLEPTMRNTAPCIAYATYKIEKQNPKALMVVSPADHLVENVNEFASDIRISLKNAASSPVLVTLGIKPHRPDTGYGYIHFQNEADEKVADVLNFTEKPPLEQAKEFLQAGNYFWNSGIFVWSAKTIQQAFEMHLPRIASLFKLGLPYYNTSEEQSFINEHFAEAESISIDYGIMEKCEAVRMVKTDFGWSDLGTWGSLYEHVVHDSNENALVGEIHIFESGKNVIRNETNRKLVVRGLEDFIVVQTKTATLICPKKEEQTIKQMLQEIKSSEG
jgi:mannose-1-phosphate guanylyltransferase